MLSIDHLDPPEPASTADPFVLLVDDHAPSLNRLRNVVEQVGHPCISANSASDALVYCDSHPPQVVVTDLAMPDLDGLGLARWLKARYPRLPIILVTGQELDPAALTVLRQTFTEVMRKPVDPESLLTLLERLMDPSSNHVRDTRRP